MAPIAPQNIAPSHFRQVVALTEMLTVPTVLFKISKATTPLVSGILRGSAIWCLPLGVEILSSTNWKESVVRLAVAGTVTVGSGMLEAALLDEGMQGFTLFPSVMISLYAMQCFSFSDRRTHIGTMEITALESIRTRASSDGA